MRCCFSLCYNNGKRGCGKTRTPNLTYRLAAFLIIRKTLTPTEIRLTARNRVSRGLLVMRVQTWLVRSTRLSMLPMTASMPVVTVGSV